jgi:putative ABC transport system ATP-binding protein
LFLGSAQCRQYLAAKTHDSRQNDALHQQAREINPVILEPIHKVSHKFAFERFTVSVAPCHSPRNWQQDQFMASRHFQPCLTARTVQPSGQSRDRPAKASEQKFAGVRNRITMVGTPAMPTTQTLIQAEHVSRDYRLGETVIRAVNDLSLEICSGEFLALLGSSGSGKSTLLNLMAGLDRPTSGAIHVRGQNLAALDSQGLARYRRETVGMVFQSFNLLPRMTLEENVELPLRLAEVDRAERSRRVAQALEHVRLGARRQHRPSELSGGEQQRGALARALVNQPAILFADEPTGNLDTATGEQILLLLREIQDTLGMTIIMVTHERPLAERFANRIAVLSDGRLVDQVAMQTGARA